MNRESPTTRTGWVLSDLHLFARRSDAELLLAGLQDELRRARVLVLNGDIVDFRWSTRSGHDETARAAQTWLGELLHRLPDCEVHYVLGNHDCLAGYPGLLTALAAGCARFHWHEYSLQLGDALFLHGDCTTRRMSVAELRVFRAGWSRDRQRSPAHTAAYLMADRLGVTRLVHRAHFPRRRTLRRLIHHLDDAQPRWQKDVRHCYFGHTHEPFADVEQGGVMFHNTGSAIRGMGFNPLRFAVPREPAATS